MKNRRKTGVLLVAMIAATFTFAALAQSASAGTMKSVLSNLCVEIAPQSGGYLPNGGSIFQQNCTGSDPQQWDLEPRGTAPIFGSPGTWSVYRFRNRATGSCLDNRNGSFDDGAPVQVWTCNNSNTMLWNIARSGFNGSQELVNARSGLCLDVHGGFLSPGVRIEQYTCPGAAPFAGQLFFF